mmetsp:Transcript_26802/g.62985  ORF Transcript_26802/g.62985 Transcript_26802/m.62985 type:complete len:96 (+) Transcript_26802:1219-1506(+)
MDTIKIARHENNSKYKITPRTRAPIFPNASLAISGKDRMGFRMRVIGIETEGYSASKSSMKRDNGRGSPLSSLPINMEVFQQRRAKLKTTKIPPQ